jgi:hypothetical protein
MGFYLVVKLPVRSKVEHLEGQCLLLLRWLLQIVTPSMNLSLLTIWPLISSSRLRGCILM